MKRFLNGIVFSALLASCASTPISKSRIVPTRYDIVGNVQNVEYTTHGAGMEKPYTAQIKAGEEVRTVTGFGSNQYKELRKAYSRHEKVAIQCHEQEGDCRVSALERIVEPVKRPQ